MAFPGYLINRALPGAVLAAIVFAVPGLSLENDQSQGNPVGPLAVGLTSSPVTTEIVPTAAMARLGGHPPAGETASIVPAPGYSIPPNIALTPPSAHRYRTETIAPREQVMAGAIQPSASKDVAHLETMPAQIGVFDPSRNRLDQSGDPGLVTVRAAEPDRLLQLPEASLSAPVSIGNQAPAPANQLPVDAPPEHVRTSIIQFEGEAKLGAQSSEIAITGTNLPLAAQTLSAATDKSVGIGQEHGGSAVEIIDLGEQSALAATRQIFNAASVGAFEASGSHVSAVDGHSGVGAPQVQPASPKPAALSLVAETASSSTLSRGQEPQVASQGEAAMVASVSQAPPSGPLENRDAASLAAAGRAAAISLPPASKSEPPAPRSAQALPPSAVPTRGADLEGQLGRGSERTAGLAEAQDPIRETLQDALTGKRDFVPRLKGSSFAAGKGINRASAVEITSRLSTRIDGRVVGELDFQQDMQTIKIRIGSIVELLQDRYETSDLERIARSASGDVYLSISQLQQAGIPISYDPVYDEIALGRKDYLPSSAHKVQIDQITTPQRDLGPIIMDQVTR